VFTIFNDVKYANANRKEEWGSMPAFFYRQFPHERLHWRPAAWDKPVVYFYAKPTPLHLKVKVTFTEGMPVVWWPAAADPLDEWPAPERKPKNRPFRALTWDAWVGDMVPLSGSGPPTKVVDFPLPKGSWLEQLRLPSASRLSVTGTKEGEPKSRPGALLRTETERFLYYDGLVPAPDYLHCEKADAASVTLRNGAKFDITRLFVVDRRVQGKVGLAVVDGAKQPFKAGTTQTFQPQPVAADDWPAAGIKQVRRALLDAGLFAAEADSLLTIWQKRFLEADGLVAFHILPASEYERMLPLEIVPAPAGKPVRVGIALHPNLQIEPKLTETVAALIRQLDDEQYATRAAASKTLLEIGPAAIGLLRAELNRKPALEKARRIEAILERVDLTDWLNWKEPAKEKGKASGGR